MGYHTNLYLLVFLPAVAAVYSLAPGKARRWILLAANLMFYAVFSRELILVLLGTAALIWRTGLAIEAAGCGEETELRRRRITAAGIAALLLMLLILKYSGFILENGNRVLHVLHAGELPVFALAVPLGISFYTLTAIGYLMDVFWQRVPAERQYSQMLLVLSYFPVIMEGPILHYAEASEPIRACRRATLAEAEWGTLRILWGLFKKMIVADRLNTAVGIAYEQPDAFRGPATALIAACYTIQLYMEFSGAMDIVVGSGALLGVRLPENFRRPFFARSAAEFWRRWHISLGVWFKTYIFYPVTASDRVKDWNRRARKTRGKAFAKLGVSVMALFPVWLCNGIWHGPRWNYIFYGLYYFVVLSAGVALEPLHRKWEASCVIKEHPHFLAALQTMRTWIIILVGETVFRADGLRAGLHMLANLFRPFVRMETGSPGRLGLGLYGKDWLIILLGTAVVAAADCAAEYRERRGEATLSRSGCRVCAYVLFLTVLLFGAYGAGYHAVDLIYAGF